MPSEVNERRAVKPQYHHHMVAPQAAEQQEHLPCPRCDSTNTKFCYYNNYNFSQPRHFCKSCRRYWTRGGALRDIPVGGASRKNPKRSRTAITTIIPSTASATNSASTCADAIPATPLFVPLSAPATAVASAAPVAASFTSLINSSGPNGLFSLGGFGLGLGSGLEDAAGFGLAKGVWAFPELGYISGNGGGGGGNGGVGRGGSTVAGGATGESGVSGNTWQMESGDGGFMGGANGECFSSWPELAISTPGNGLK